MKLLIQNNRIAGTATDAYTGPDEFITAPADFDPNRMADYVVAAGMVVLPEPGVPQQVTMRQARLALLKAGLLSDIPGAIATLPSPQKEEAEIEWEYAAIVQRNSGLVPTMGLALGLTEQQLDEMFTLAATL